MTIFTPKTRRPDVDTTSSPMINQTWRVVRGVGSAVESTGDEGKRNASDKDSHAYLRVSARRRGKNEARGKRGERKIDRVSEVVGRRGVKG